MNSKIEQENLNKSKISNENEIKSKYDSINSWLDDENSKYSQEITPDKKKENPLIKDNINEEKIKEPSKKDILSNINKLIEENEKKDQYFIYKKNNKINNNYNYSNNKNNNNYNYQNINNINTSDILGLTLELNETKKTNNLMKETIQDLKNEISKNELQYQENLTNALEKQKFEYEDKIQNLKNLIYQKSKN